MKNKIYTVLAVFLCMFAAYAQAATSTIWGAPHASVSAANRLPVDTSNLSGPGYNSLGDILGLISGDCTVNTLTGAITCTKTGGSSFAAVATSGSASDLTTGTLSYLRLPTPTTSQIGGVKAVNQVGSQWISYIDTNGVPHLTQPQDADLFMQDLVNNNSTVSAHGFLKKLNGNNTYFMDGTGNWSQPSAFTSIKFTGDGTVLSNVASFGPFMSATLANAGANTILGNGTGSSAAPTYLTAPSCSTSASALQWTSGTGFACNTAIAAPAGSLTGSSLAAGVTGSSLTSVGALSSGSLTTGFTTIAAAQGGTGQTSIANAYTSFYESVATTLGDIIYGGASGAPTRLAGNTTSTAQFLTSTGSGGLATAPSWTQPSCSSLSNGASGCSTATGTSGATIPLLNATATISGAWSFTNNDLLLIGTSTGKTTLNSGLTGAGNNTLTLPTTASDTLAATGTAQTFSALQTFNNSDIAMVGSSTGKTTLTSDNAGASNFTVHLPAANDTIAFIAASQTLTGKTYDTAGVGNTFKINGTTITAISGNTATVGTTSGTLTSGDCVKFDASGNLVDNGASCGGSPAFSSITGATNTTAAMVVGTGASLATSGTGTITATGLTSGATGTTQSSYDNSTKIATDAYVDTAAAGYVSQSGTSVSIGTGARGELEDFTGSSNSTFTLPSCTTAGASWYVYVRNSGTSAATVLINSSAGTIDTQAANNTTYIMYSGEERRFDCGGTNYTSQLLHGGVAVFTSSGSWNRPPGYNAFQIEIISSGGSGAARTTTGNAGGGAGSNSITLPMISASYFVAAGSTETVTVGGTAAGVSGNSAGNPGNASSITINGVTLSIGGPTAAATAALSSAAAGGGGGAAPVTFNGQILGTSGLNYGYTDGGDVTSGNVPELNANFVSGIAAAGAGGASSSVAGGVRTGGSSVNAGAGGAGGANTGGNGTNGTAPGGGGGGAVNGGTSGSGARGEIRVRGII